MMCSVAMLAAAAACEGPPDLEEVTSPITGGALVTSNTPPFDSVVKIASSGGGCTATKIGNRRFITAAHCLIGVTAGQTMSITNRLDGALPSTFTLTSVDRHPSFDRTPSSGGYDVGVVAVSGDTPAIPPLSVRSPFVGVGTPGLFVGYGCDFKDPTHSGRKQRANLKAALCGADPNTDVHAICDFDPVVRVCAGDSGSPWLIQTSGVWRTAGVAVGAFPNGFTRIGNVRRWIASPAKNVFANNERGFIMNFNSGNCAGIAGGSDLNGGTAVQTFCDGRNQPTDTQYWRLLSSGSTTFNLRNGKSGRCMGVAGGSVDDGALVQQFDCALGVPTNNQSWRFVQASGDYYQVVNGKSGKCLSVAGASTGSGAVLIQSACSPLGSKNDQSWIFIR
jgi:hypothetical protein